MSSLFRRFGRLLRSNILPTGESTSRSENFTDWQPNRERSEDSPVPPRPEDTDTRHYRALELQSSASFEEIRSAYKRLMKKYHPDRFPQDPQKKQYAELVSQQLNEAYAYFEKKHGR